MSYARFLCTKSRGPNELQQQVGRHCAALLRRGCQHTEFGRGLAPSISGMLLVARIREKNDRTLGILRMKEPLHLA